MASCPAILPRFRALAAPSCDGSASSDCTGLSYPVAGAFRDSRRSARALSPWPASCGLTRAQSAAAWSRRESSALRSARISGAEISARKPQRECAMRAGKSGFGESSGRERGKGRGKGKGKEKTKGKGDKELVTVALTGEDADVADMSEEDLEAAIEALFSQLASDLEADADVDGTSFAAGDADVELDDDELAVLQAELDAALAEMTAEVEREEGEEGGGEVDEEERALVAELGLEEEEEEEEEEYGEEGGWEGGMSEQAEGRQEGSELKVTGLRGDGMGKEGGLLDVPGVIPGAAAAAVAGAGATGAGVTGAGATGAGVTGAGATGAGATGAGATGAGATGAGVKEGRSAEVGKMRGDAEETEEVEEVRGGRLQGEVRGGSKEKLKGRVNEYDEEEEEEEEDEEEEEEEESSVQSGKGRREVQLQRWQLKKLAMAVQTGKRQVNVKALAAETHLPRKDVLAFLRHPPDVAALFPDLLPPASPSAPNSSPDSAAGGPATADGGGGREEAVGESGKGKEAEGGGEGKGADRLGMSEEGKKEWQERWMKGKRIRQEHLSTLEAVYQRSKYPTNTMVANLVSVTRLPRSRILQWFEDRRGRTETGRAQREMRTRRR